MSLLPDSMRTLIAELSELPSIGPRQATRLAFYLVARKSSTLAGALRDIGSLAPCARCFFITENEDGLCDVCRDNTRDPKVVLVVEKETDLLSFERARTYRGTYLVLGPIPRVGALENYQRDRIAGFTTRITKEADGKIKEIILGFDTTRAGDFGASVVSKELAPLAKKISRLGRGLPTGGEVEFADDETLGAALERRS